MHKISDMKKRTGSCFACSILLLMLGSLSSCNEGEEKPPNIIIILSDDMGFSDLGCYGGEIRTPNLDELAYNGLRFTQFYNTARCHPTRGSLITGLYPHQAGMGGGGPNQRGELPGYQGEISNHALTIAEALKTSGYMNYAVGKWHLTGQLAPDGPKGSWPLQRGFNKFYGTIMGAGSFWDPGTLTRDNTRISPFNDPEYPVEDLRDFYYTDAISDNAVKYIADHDPSTPFFMYVAYTAAHWPMHAPEDEIKKYDGMYDQGWEPIRKERFKRLVDMGLIDPAWGISPAEYKGWEDEENKDWMIRRMQVYATMVDIMDQGIGRIVKSLKDKGEFDNTLIFYLQDNGASREGKGAGSPVTPENWESMAGNPMSREELQHNMIPEYTRDGRPVRMGQGVMPGAADTYVSYGMEWANVSNTPFRKFKVWNHEGGISTPLIISWPDGLEAPGEFRNQAGHLIDIMATCIEVSGADYPSEYDGHQIMPLEGKSLVPAFRNENIERDFILWEHGGHCAIRVGDWKLVYERTSRPFVVPGLEDWELYNMAYDRTELNDLADAYPEKVEEMDRLWKEQAIRTYILPRYKSK